MRRSKGFPFLLDAIEAMPDAMARGITLTVAAKKLQNTDEYERLLALRPRLAALRYFDGYTHAELPDILGDVHLGIVPPVWEDNLPQVAIEIVARGIPVLTSDRGGAQEIARHLGFVFRAGSVPDFLARIEAIGRRDLPLADFWSRPMHIVSMQEHLDELLGIYGARDRALPPAGRGLCPLHPHWGR